MINEILDRKIEQSKILASALKKYTSLNNPESFDSELLLLKKKREKMYYPNKRKDKIVSLRMKLI